MKKLYYFCTMALLILLISCAEIKPVNSSSNNNELLEFAKVNCMFWYFKKMKYSTKDISAISGGIVELGSSSAEKYRKVAFMVKEYNPHTPTNIDIDLLKCFKMEIDNEFISKIENLK